MFRRPRGTRDFRPEEMELRREVEDKMRRMASLHGFREVSTPIFEEEALFTARSGPAIVKEMYSFADKSGRRLALRPELTAPTVRFCLNDLMHDPKPLKLFYFGPCFRYERPQKGRYREFYHFGAELIGGKTPLAQAEVISFAYSILQSLNLDVELRIGNVRIVRRGVQELSPKREGELLMAIDRGDMECTKEHLGDSWLFHLLEGEAVRAPVAIREELEKMEELFSILDEMGIPYNRNFRIVRGLDYYDGIVFEMHSKGLGTESQICGGGDYDLSTVFGVPRFESTGFAIGFDRAVLAIDKVQKKKGGVRCYVLPLPGVDIAKGFSLLHRLRSGGVSADIDLVGRGLDKGLRYCSTIGAKYCLILGKKEVEKGEVTLRDMESGEQRSLRIEELDLG
jgi:histidyl-tRNA synthetase